MRSAWRLHEDCHRHSAYIVEPLRRVWAGRARRTVLRCLVTPSSIKKIDRASLLPKLLGRLVCLRLASLFLSRPCR